MSRFSKNSARVIGYAFFAMAGTAIYYGYQGRLPFAAAETLENSLVVERVPIVLGATGEYATELSSVITRNSFNDPIVPLTPNQRPKWAAENNYTKLESLTSTTPNASVPIEYPYEIVKPLSVPVHGDAVSLDVKTVAAKPALRSLAPEPLVAAARQHEWNSSSSGLPMEPINRLSQDAQTEGTLAASQSNELTWPDRGMIVFNHVKQDFLNGEFSKPWNEQDPNLAVPATLAHTSLKPHVVHADGSVADPSVSGASVTTATGVADSIQPQLASGDPTKSHRNIPAASIVPPRQFIVQPSQ